MGKLLPVCEHVNKWLTKLESTKEVLGLSNSTGAQITQDTVKKLAAPNIDKEFEKRQLIRLKFVQSLSQQFEQEQGIINIYAEVVKQKTSHRMEELHNVDGSFKHPATNSSL